MSDFENGRTLVELMAAAIPSVELVRPSNDYGQSSWSHWMDSCCRPLVPPGECARSRWMGCGALAVDVRGLRRYGRPVANVLIEQGHFWLLVTDHRLLGVFPSAITVEWGRVDLCGTNGLPAVVAMNWPLHPSMRTEAQPGDGQACRVISDKPYAVLRVDRARRVDDSWRIS